MVYREGVIGESMTRKWFAKFKNGNFDIDDTPHSRKPFEFDKDHLKALLKEESRQTSHELAKKMNCNHLHSIRFAKKFSLYFTFCQLNLILRCILTNFLSGVAFDVYFNIVHLYIYFPNLQKSNGGTTGSRRLIGTIS